MSRTRGFVLMDLLITTVFITALAAFLFPVFLRTREKGRTCVCQSNLRQIGMALQVYAKDNYGRYPPTDNDLTPLTPYLQGRGVLICPTRISAKVNSYTYHGGYAHDDSSRQILAHDPENILIHSEGINVLFLDGHVKWLRTTDNQFRLGLEGKPPPLPKRPPPPPQVPDTTGRSARPRGTAPEAEGTPPGAPPAEPSPPPPSPLKSGKG